MSLCLSPCVSHLSYTVCVSLSSLSLSPFLPPPSQSLQFVSIITCRIIYIAFRQHRFVFNFGYGFDSNDTNMMTTTMLITSAFIELLFEGVVDAYALSVESENGIDLNAFWTMWKANGASFWGLAVADSLLAAHTILWGFKLLPSAAFCTSPKDPCSCSGGGFEIYAPFCQSWSATGSKESSNETSSSLSNASSAASPATASASAEALSNAKNEYSGLFSALAADTAIILISIGVVFVTIIVFTLARVCEFRRKVLGRL